MDIKKFIISDKIENDYNKMIQNELDVIKNKANNNERCMFKVSECDFLKPSIKVSEMWNDPNIQEFIKICGCDTIGFSGPMIKNYLCPKIEEAKGIKIKKIYIATILNHEIKSKYIFKKFMNQNNEGQTNLIKKNDNYFIINISDYTFCLNKRSYNSLSHAMFSCENAIDRIILNEQNLWVSGMFILDLYNKISCFDTNNIDPIFGLPEDILDIYDRSSIVLCNKNVLTGTGARAIDMVSIDDLQKISKDVIEKTMHSYTHKNIDQKYTTLEYALIKMMENNHPVIVYQMRGIIMYLSQYQYQRPIFFVAKMIGFDKKYPGLYEGLIEIKHKINIDPSTDIKSLESDYHIDMFILNHLIKCDDEKHFFEYMIQMGIVKKFKQKSKTAEKIIDWIIEHKAFITAKSLIESKIVDENYKFKIVFLTQSFDLLDQEFVDTYITDDSNHKLSPHYQTLILDNLNKIIEHGLTRSFFVILKLCPHILECCDSGAGNRQENNNKDDDSENRDEYQGQDHDQNQDQNQDQDQDHDQNQDQDHNQNQDESVNKNRYGSLIHSIKSDSSVDILEIILKNNIKLIDCRDKNGKTPLIAFAEIGLGKCITKLLEYGADYELTDNYSDTFLHKLCERGYLDIICNVIRNIINIIDAKNDRSMTPSIVAVLNSHEEIFYVLKGLNADLETTDVYGNTVYHYICGSKICPGLLIINKKNKFGFTPYDYCKIDHKFYYFHDY